MTTNVKNLSKPEFSKNKILLQVLPFWSPMIPPQGNACLKAYLQKYGYDVKVEDPNVDWTFRELYSKYYDIFKKITPEEKQGNFYNIGHFVIANHLLAHTNYTNEQDYKALVKEIVYQIYFVHIEEPELAEMIEIANEFYRRLEKYLIELVEREKPGYFGLSVFSHTLGPSLFAFRLIRERYPHITTVMGGGILVDHLSAESPDFEFFLDKTKDYIDTIIIGEGQKLFLKYLNGELPPKRYYTLQDINNELMDPSEEELPDFSDYKPDLYPYLPAFGSKSCPFNCSFCTETIFNGVYRKKDAKKVFQEMKTLYEKYGIQLFFMSDALINPYITDLAKEFIKSDISLYYDSYFRVDAASANIENTMLWRRGGFYRARLGVESGSQRLLDLMEKGIKVEQSKASLHGLASAGIKTTAYLVIGHPGETEEDIQKTFDFIEEMKDDIYQVECNFFEYFYTGQPESDQWAPYRTLLYPENARDMLITQTWVTTCEPSREETFRRMNRVVEFCKKLGIPNPYTINEHYEAENRWARLHKNAVPSFLELKDHKIYIDECKHAKQFITAQDTKLKNMNFVFK